MNIKFSLIKNMEEGRITIYSSDPVSDLALKWLSNEF